MKKFAILSILLILAASFAAGAGARDSAGASDKVQVSVSRSPMNFLELQVNKVSNIVNEPFDYEPPQGVDYIG